MSNLHPDDNRISHLDMESSWGAIRIVAKDGQIRSCELPLLSVGPRKPFEWLASDVNAASAADGRALKKAERFVRDIFGGKNCEPPPFAWPESSPFSLRVWRALQAIPFGATLEYGAVARKIGRPRASRAVGRACGANPLPLFIPCHRVLPKDGTLGGFTGGLPWKRLLLEKEGVLQRGPPVPAAGSARPAPERAATDIFK
jgi:O-6-methylguanine DNA methyltransferase